MSFRLFLFSVLLSTFAGGGELPWIGVTLDLAGAKDRGAVGLQAGVGLKVAGIVKTGPYALAGGSVGDLWWKLDDQVLINRSQMLVLLRSKSPGDSVTMTYYRNAKLKSLTFVLGSDQREKLHPIGITGAESDAARVVTKREQVARLSVGREELTLKREGEAWRFTVMEGETSVLSALIFNNDLGQEVPAKWHDSFLMLKLTLDQQSSRPQKEKSQRTRYVPRGKASEK